MLAGSPCLTGIFTLACFFFVLCWWYITENKLHKTFTKIGVETKSLGQQSVQLLPKELLLLT